MPSSMLRVLPMMSSFHRCEISISLWPVPCVVHTSFLSMPAYSVGPVWIALGVFQLMPILNSAVGR